jgi:isoquinoline 1-oxidoreductase subunit beta
MNTDSRWTEDRLDLECCGPEETLAPAEFSRRGFVQLLGAGLLISAGAEAALGQRRGSAWGRGGTTTVAARLHIDHDGLITVMTGKVEAGQGSRAEITQAAAEELRVAAGRLRLIMADTDLTPDDGITAGSRTTPATIPAVRKAAAAARGLLLDLAGQRWKLDRAALEARDGAVVHTETRRTITYAELARANDLGKAFSRAVPADVAVTPVSEWKVMGTSLPRPNRRDIVTGTHRFPSDIVRPGMLYGKILRPVSFGATLAALDLAPAKAMPGVVVVRDGSFVGCAAPSLFQAEQAMEALAKTANWQTRPQPSSKELFAYLKQHAQAGGGRGGAADAKDIDEELGRAKKTAHESYEVAYIQHAPMEPRAAVAEWRDGKLTVWTGSTNPFGVRGELSSAFGLAQDKVRVIVPDTGGSFGGKHSGEAAVEAARLAKAAGKPVCLRWSREEEFTWAYFRPAALIEVRAGLSAAGALAAWDFTNINSGGAAIDFPYEVAKKRTRFVQSDPPLRQSSYRALAATANNFARESFMDELACLAGADPLAFRLAHLRNDRLRNVLEAAAKEFRWAERREKRSKDAGVGLACGTEKGSFVAACVEATIDRKEGRIHVERVCQVFECGAIQNPANLLSQVQGCIIMGLGGALSEEVRFQDGQVRNPRFSSYQVPRFKDVPQLDLHLLNRPDLPSVGAGETPLIAVAPAVANAVFHACRVRIRSMPIRGAALKEVS